MVNTEVAQWVISEDLHESFATLSGDRNPMHMDAVAARRTPAGNRVVHGIHSLLRGMEMLAAEGLFKSRPVRVRARFLKWVYPNEVVRLMVPGVTTVDPPSFELKVSGLVVLAVDITYSDSSSDWLVESNVDSPRATLLGQPLDLLIEDLDGATGVAYTALSTECRGLFPVLTNLLGVTAVAEIAACSYVVGMQAPGLHSMFSKTDLQLSQCEGNGALRYHVTYTDPRFRKIRVQVTGSAVSGTIEAFVRVPPVQQLSIAEIAEHVRTNEFAGIHALIVGGSRGLGELTAKIIAAGGGTVVITYSVGEKDASAVQDQIAQGGGEATLLQYDVRKASARQLASLSEKPTHLFYFATATIFRPKQEVLNAVMLEEFTRFYLHGFYDICVTLACSKRNLRVFYPSTVFIEERPAGMTEYAMIKAAGEQLCRDLNQYLPGIQVLTRRLPKLPTDQTAGVVPERDTDGLMEMLHVVRQMADLACSLENAPSIAV